MARGAEPFRDQVLPFVKSYCVQCYNGTKAEGELNLVRFTSAAMVADDFRQWEHVVTFLKNEEMPPDKAKQPTAAERATALQTIEARQLAGDPGVVLPRRLSNADYNYAIRDLMGVDMRPTDSFPVAPASGEGFNNTGEVLLVNPSVNADVRRIHKRLHKHLDGSHLPKTRPEFSELRSRSHPYPLLRPPTPSHQSNSIAPRYPLKWTPHQPR